MKSPNDTRESASLLERLRAPGRIEALYGSGLLDAPRDADLDRFTILISRLLNAPVALISLVDVDRQFLLSSLGVPEPWATQRETPLSHSFCQHVTATGEPLVVTDARTDAVLRDNLAIGDLGVIAYAGVPLRSPDGEVLGSFCAIDLEPREWTSDDVETLRTIATSVETEIALRGLARDIAEKEDLLRDLLDNSSDMVMASTAEGEILFVNEAWRQTLGYAEDEVAALRPVDLVAPEFCDAYVDAARRLLRGEPVDAFRTVLLSRDGRRVVVEGRSSVRIRDGVQTVTRTVFRDVTAEAESASFNERLLRTLEATPDFVGIATADGQVVYINRAGRRMLGVPEEGELDLRLNELRTPAEWARIQRDVYPVAASQGVWTGETHLRRSDGVEIPVSQVLVGHPSAQSPDVSYFYTTIMRDMRPQKRIEAELRLLQEITQRLSEADDTAAAYLVTLEELCEMMGWPYGEVWLPNAEDEFLEQGPVWCDPADVELAAFAHGSARLTFAPGVGIAGIGWEREQLVWLHTAATPPGSPRADAARVAGLRTGLVLPVMSGDTVVSVIVLMAREQHPRDEESVAVLTGVAGQLGEVLRRRSAELAEGEAERRFRTALATLRTLAVTLDVRGDVTFANDHLLQSTGWTHAEVIGHSWFERFIPDAVERQQQYREMISGGEIPVHSESDIVCRDGGRRLISWDNTMLRDADGRTVGTASIGHDITEQRRVARLKDELIGLVSHEIRTPLGAIRGAVQLLQARLPDLPDAEMRLMSVATRNTDRLMRLVNDLLDIERVESGTADVDRQVFPAVLLLEDVVEATQPLADRAEVALRIVPLRATVWADTPRVMQVLTNLVGNAIKFSPAGSTITVGAEAGPDEVRFYVQDEGRGIPADKLDSIFNRFEQVDPSDAREKGGAGLGLAIAKAIVQQHGGRIWAVSTPGQGSTFSFTLPTAQHAIALADSALP